jgi:hypothetical protein
MTRPALTPQSDDGSSLGLSPLPPAQLRIATDTACRAALTGTGEASGLQLLRVAQVLEELVGRGSTLLVTQGREPGTARWIDTRLPVRADTIGFLTDAAEATPSPTIVVEDALRGGVRRPGDFPDGVAIRSLVGIRCSPPGSPLTAVFIAQTSPRRLTPRQQIALDALAALAAEGRSFACPPTVFTSPAESPAAQRELTGDVLPARAPIRESIAAMLDSLSMSRPTAHAAAVATSALITAVLQHIPTSCVDATDLAALSSTLGAVGLSGQTLDAFEHDVTSLTEAQLAELHQMPDISAGLLERLPGATDVVAILRLQSVLPYTEAPPAGVDPDLLAAASVLRAVALFHWRVRAGLKPVDIARTMMAEFAPQEKACAALKELACLDATRLVRQRQQEVPLAEARAGMVTAEDVHDADGVLLLREGTSISVRQLHRLKQLPADQRTHLRVLVPSTPVRISEDADPPASGLRRIVGRTTRHDNPLSRKA